MKVPLKWLKEYADITRSPADIAEKLTMAGSEVKGIRIIGDNWENIIIGQITTVNPHPNADRLHLPTIDLGAEQKTVVCGAPNLKVGDKIAFASIGAQLIDPYKNKLVTLTPAKIRGVSSKGMICSEKELGISDNHEGIMVLPPEAPVGTPLADYLGETVFDLDITPNRPDCLSVIGISREVAALTDTSTLSPKISYEEATASISERISVEITSPDLCYRYCASLIDGIKIAESPRWMQERLLACGMRPINNIVDITNYVMLEHGQPLHAFNYEKIRGKKIIVRRADSGEIIESLDEVDRTLSDEMLVIADKDRTVAIAGIMGGANSEVTEDTTTILLEAASFNPANIHYTAARLQLASEASMRFERGITPGLVIPALKRATQLITELAGGKAAKGIVDVYPGKQEPKPILLTTSKVARTLGVEFSPEQVTTTLTSLGFTVKSTDSTQTIMVTTPYWRSDISQSIDLVEEVARIIGYDQIPTKMLSGQIPHHNPSLLTDFVRKARLCLVSYGFQELITYSLVGLETLEKLYPDSHSPKPSPLRLVNPMTAEQEYLRPDLRANLLTTLAANRRHEEGGIRFFELDKVFLPRDKDLPDEPEVLGGIMSGTRTEKSCLDGENPFVFSDAKGTVENLLKHLNVEASFEPSADEGLLPLMQAAIIINGNNLGIIGKIHPKVTDAFEIYEPVYLFELNITELLPLTTEHKTFRPLSRFPSIVRDMALIVDRKTTHRQVQDIIQSFPLVTDVNIFDVYHGKQVQSDKKSLAYRIVYQSPDHTLVDEEVNKIQEKILEKLSQQLDATLRV
ncbi:phenylalanine--tRNA ligase subunit beta [Chloroflexota bacterium]